MRFHFTHNTVDAPNENLGCAPEICTAAKSIRITRNQKGEHDKDPRSDHKLIKDAIGELSEN